MDRRLEELKTQRALIAQHLKWLDREIQSLESGDPKAPDTSAETSDCAVSVAPPEEAAPGSATDVERAELSLPHPGHGITSRQRLGCIVIAVALAASSILIFWVLPHLLYD